MRERAGIWWRRRFWLSPRGWRGLAVVLNIATLGRCHFQYEPDWDSRDGWNPDDEL